MGENKLLCNLMNPHCVSGFEVKVEVKVEKKKIEISCNNSLILV